MKGKFYGIGVGPGDPELITLKAISAIEKADVLICPDAGNGKKSIALEIGEAYVKATTERVPMTFPMVYDEEVLNKSWEDNAVEIESYINQGKNVAFITLGDPGVFSTFMYIVPFLVEKGIEIETIPGVTSFSAVASTMNLPICLWEETFTVVPLQKDITSARTAIENSDNVIIMKPSHANKALAELLIEKGLDDKFVMISKVSTDRQNIVRDINVLKDEKVPYMSTIIVKRKGI